MKKTSKLLSMAVIASVAFLATGCTYKYSAGASTVDISKTDMAKVETLKSGEACVSHILFFIPTSLDATAQTAAKNGGINQIAYQEVSHTDALIFRSSCVKVYGN